MIALIVMGMQYDHLAGGALPVPGAEDLLIPIRQQMHNVDSVILCREWHPENHYTFADNPRYMDGSWPAHCVQGTKGARIHPSLRKYANCVISMGMQRNEESYSAFSGKTLRPVMLLEEILQDIDADQVQVAGVRLGVEVLYTALDASALGYDTTVLSDCTVSTPENYAWTVPRFDYAGVKFLDAQHLHHVAT